MAVADSRRAFLPAPPAQHHNAGGPFDFAQGRLRAPLRAPVRHRGNSEATPCLIPDLFSTPFCYKNQRALKL
jgi:hypothetical protein